MESATDFSNSQRESQKPRRLNGAFGPGCETESDGHRLSTQMLRIRDLMTHAAANGRWLTLAEIRADLETQWRCPFPEASISAQLRHLRKPTFGSFCLEKRRRHGRGFGLFEYRLLQPKSLACAERPSEPAESDFMRRRREEKAHALPLFADAEGRA